MSEERIFESVDDFIDYGSMLSEPPKNESYARWVLNHFRLPAIMRFSFDEFMSKHKLFCAYEGKKYRVTGASRLGDVWLARNHSQEHGYDLRVDVNHITDWMKK